jgi:NAD(P)-dependent dehydrogenase (short-subunit alcohol dehydrogenase family)
MDPNGLTALVTGGGSGLGGATARALAARGARVAVVDRNKEAADAVANEIGGLAVGCDVTDAEGAEAAFAEIEAKLGTPRILINCAGIAVAQRIVGKAGAQPLTDFERVIRVNLIGTFNMMRLATARMIPLEPIGEAGRGVIVSTASVAAFDGQIGQAAYAASKGGVAALTLPAARELAQFGIRVMAIAPGLFKTPLLEALPIEAQNSLAVAIPFPQRLGHPSEFGQLVCHIVENDYLNGEVIRFDGALRMAPR